MNKRVFRVWCDRAPLVWGTDDSEFLCTDILTYKHKYYSTNKHFRITVEKIRGKK